MHPILMNKIGRYEIIRELGRGGMATVFLAQDPYIGRQVAIKVLPHQFTHDPQFRGRFEREAKVIAALEHPSIVPIYDYGEEGDQPYIVMRYMAGGTLADRLSKKPMPLEQVIPILQSVAEALNYAHHKGIVHRDLKPENILFDDDNHAFLSDFGIVKLLEGSAAYTGTNVIGTPAYMSPEQATGEKTVDNRSDIYSLGVILYEMVTGQHPYKSETITPVQLILKHVTAPMPPVNTASLGLPAECNTFLARAMAKKPQDRFQSAPEMATALQAVQEHKSADGTMLLESPPTFVPSLAPRRRYFWIFLVGTGIFIACVGFMGAAALLWGSLKGWITPTPTPTPLPTFTQTITPSATPRPTSSPTASPTATFTQTPTPTRTRFFITITRTPTPTDTLTPTNTSAPSGGGGGGGGGAPTPAPP